MEIKPEISEINAYNDDLTNYWTGDPSVEPEVSITFDLACIRELTEIGIHFWKADERTTTFSIDVADVAGGPFTTIINNATSADTGVTVDTEQLFSLAGTSARYVKFIGIGNSSSSSWTSIANINIYGNINCADGSSSIFNQPVDLDVTVFPVPVTNGILNVLSESKELGLIEIYNVTGQKVLMTDGRGQYSKQINVTELNAGIYFVRLEGIGLTKFIVK